MKPKFDKKFYENRKIIKGNTKDCCEMRYLINTIVKLLKIPKSGHYKILDIGCNDGYILNKLYEYNNNLELYGIDISKNSIQAAQKINRGNKINFLLGNGSEIDFPNSYFDFVICSQIIEHVSDYTKTISEIERILKNQGKCFVTIPNNINEKHLFYKLKNKVDIIEGHIKSFEVKEISVYFKKSKLIYYEYTGHIFTWMLYCFIYSKHKEKVLSILFKNSNRAKKNLNIYPSPNFLGKLINYPIYFIIPLEKFLFKNNPHCLGAILIFEKTQKENHF